MNKLYAIKIKRDDGSYSDEIPINVLAENVDWDASHTLVDILGTVDTSTSIQDQITNLVNTKATQASVNSLQTKFNNIIAAATQDTEVIYARVGSDNTVYTTLKNRLDSENINLKNEIIQLAKVDSDFNATDALIHATRENVTKNGVTYAWNSDGSCTVSGTATNSAYCDLYSASNELPFWLETQKRYNLTYSGNRVGFRIFIYENGVLNNTPICSTYTDATFVIPSSATGLIVRLNVAKNVTANETVDPHIYVGMSNDDIVSELSKSICMIKGVYDGNDADEILDNRILICDGATTAHLPDSTSAFVVETSYTTENQNNGYQIAYRFNNGKRYWRRKSGREWSNWITYDTIINNDYFSEFGVISYYGVLSAGNLNDIDKTSIYLLNKTTDYANAPVEEGYVFTYKISTLITVQFIIEFSSGKMYYRRKGGASGIWSDWTVNLSVPLKYVAFGDSLTWGAVWDMDQTTSLYQAAKKYQIPTRIAHAIGMENNFVNKAVGGFGYYAGSQSMTDKIKEYDFTDVELVTIMAGVNDKANASHPLGSADNPGTGTICGAIKEIIDWFNSNYPKVQLIFIQPTPSGHLVDNWGGTLAGGWSLNTFDTEVKQLCHDNHVGYVNWWECTFCKNRNDFSGGYSYNGTTLVGPNYSHPTNELDYARLGDFIAGKVSTLFHGGNN